MHSNRLNMARSIFAWLWPVALLGGCGDDALSTGFVPDTSLDHGDAGSCAPAPCPSEAFWDDRECACVPSSLSGRCDLDEVVGARLGRAIDCGTVSWMDDDARVAEAHDCMVTALEKGQPVRLIQELRGIDSSVADAYLVDQAGAASVLHYDSDPSGGGGAGARVEAQPCASLSVDASCTPSAADTCLVCDMPGEATLACRARPEST
jgi:hypothetical protein